MGGPTLHQHPCALKNRACLPLKVLCFDPHAWVILNNQITYSRLRNVLASQSLGTGPPRVDTISHLCSPSDSGPVGTCSPRSATSISSRVGLRLVVRRALGGPILRGTPRICQRPGRVSLRGYSNSLSSGLCGPPRGDFSPAAGTEPFLISLRGNKQF